MQGLRDFEREDFDAMGRNWSDDVLVSGPEGWPEVGPFVGRAAVRGQFERLTSDFASHRFRDVNVVRDDGEWVVLGFLWDVSGAESGATITSSLAASYRLRDGKLTEAHFRWTAEEALAAAGIKPDG